MQAQRDGTLGRLDSTALFERLEPATTVLDALNALSLHCQDLLNLALMLQPDLCNSQPMPDIAPDSRKRIDGFRRRSAMRNMPEGDLIHHLMAIVPALVAAQAHIEATRERIRRLGAEPIHRNEALFLGEVSRRYGLERAKQNG